MKNNFIAWLDEVEKKDIAKVGGKGANLGEMVSAKIPVPFGFVVTADSYFQFIETSGLKRIITELLKNLDHNNSDNLHLTAKNIQKEILKAKIPENIAKEIMLSYLDLNRRARKGSSVTKKLITLFKNPLVAVRSSATAEDLPDASFAGQQETFLNIHGEANLVKAVHQAWASLFTPRAIFYREENKFDHLKVGIAIVVQLMVNSKSSGVMFTMDPVTNDKNTIVVEAIYGLGELIVQGIVTPDHFEFDKKTLEMKKKSIAYQDKMMVKKHNQNLILRLSQKEGNKPKISDKIALEVAKLGIKFEKHYYFPQDIEWAVEDNQVYIVQTRPITTIKKITDVNNLTSQEQSKDMTVIAKGDPASPGIGFGPAKVIMSAKEINLVKAQDVLVTQQTNPDFVPAMKKASAIVTEKGGRTSHAAIVSRELGIPAVVGAADVIKKIKTGTIVTVNGATGEIFLGSPPHDKKHVLQVNDTHVASQNVHHKTVTKVYVNLATPDRADEVAKMNVDGIGLLRAEFMIADIGIHPKKLIKDKKEKLFISKLSADLAKFCHAFNPRPVVYRATDFKTNEYRNLIGGKEFEPEEPNPMLGYRGAYRYMSDPKVFELELETIKHVRNKLGYKNLWLMLPFVRTVKELVEVKKIITNSGLLRSPTFKLWMMVEIPSNVILLDEFCKVGIDGVSIGSNDLTMLILGTDRDNTEVASEYDERNPAVIWAIEKVIETARKYKVTVSICGQAPSDYPEMVERIVELGITSMSVNPDAVNSAREIIYQAERKKILKLKNNK
jgi:pyruvate,water dikinase